MWQSLARGRKGYEGLSTMKRYAIRYARIATNHAETFAAVVEAETPELAVQLLRHHLGDHSGVSIYQYSEPVEYVPPASKGQIIFTGGKAA